MHRLGAGLIIRGALAVAAALLTYTGTGLREVGFVLVGGVASPRVALGVGVVLLAVGAVLRRRGRTPAA
jgi:hypothetical protein